MNLEEKRMPRKKGTLEKVTEAVTDISETVINVSNTVEGVAETVREVAHAVRGKVKTPLQGKVAGPSSPAPATRAKPLSQTARVSPGTKPAARRQPSTQKRQARPRGRPPRGTR
jgi:hypothetical protein